MTELNTINEDSFEPTDAELVILNASDLELEQMRADHNLEIMPRRNPELTQEQINLAIAKIAGWTDIHEWNPNPKEEKPVKTWQGTNEAHPELGSFIPKYTEDLGTINGLLDELDLNYEIMRWGGEHKKAGKYFIVFENFKPDYQDVNHPFYPWFVSLSFGLCKLLLAINPDPIVPKVAVIEATFG